MESIAVSDFMPDMKNDNFDAHALEKIDTLSEDALSQEAPSASKRVT